MQSVKTEGSRSYEDFLINSLKDSDEAAAYITAIFEEEDPEPELLTLCLGHVASALGSEQDREWVKNFSQNHQSQAVYELAEWLNRLGLLLTVTIKR